MILCSIEVSVFKYRLPISALRTWKGHNNYNNGILYYLHCSSTVLPKGPFWCNTDSLLYEDSLLDSDVTRSRQFRQGNLWVQLYSRMKTVLLVPRRASNHRLTTSWDYPGVSTLISAPRSLTNSATKTGGGVSDVFF